MHGIGCMGQGLKAIYAQRWLLGAPGSHDLLPGSVSPFCSVISVEKAISLVGSHFRFWLVDLAD